MHSIWENKDFLDNKLPKLQPHMLQGEGQMVQELEIQETDLWPQGKRIRRHFYPARNIQYLAKQIPMNASWGEQKRKTEGSKRKKNKIFMIGIKQLWKEAFQLS